MKKKKQEKTKKNDFGAEIAKILPSIMREFTKMQRNLFLKIRLTISQIVILEFLAEQGACRMNELGKALNSTMSAVTAIVDKMITLKLVKRERSRKDRRVVKVILLDKGKKTAKRVRDGRRNCANELFAKLTRKDKDEYIRILKKVYNNLRSKK